MRVIPSLRARLSHLKRTLFTLAAWVIGTTGNAFAEGSCTRTLTAEVVALDQPFFWNRLGAFQPQGMIFALRRDVVDQNSGLPEAQGGTLTAGQVELREGKRPRPLVLRMNVGDCLTIEFQNLLAPSPADDEQPATRTASVRVIGMQLVDGIGDDGSHVGKNASSLAAPGQSRTYTLYAEREGGNLLYSAAATTGGEGDGGSIPAGLFGAVNVEPEGSEWYRSQVTYDDMVLATVGTTPDGQPIMDWTATYPAGHPQAGRPILAMVDDDEIVHSDLTAIVTGPNRGALPVEYPVNTVLPNREQPFREFTAIFHDEIGAVQAFDEFEDEVLGFTLHSARDGFAINYGTAGIGAEVLANRKGVGPMKQCNECKYEEFFLSSWAVGDPAMVVNNPANSGKAATKALYPDDPSNVYHSYINDHVKFRNIHAGPKEHHIFHLHAHQWVGTPDADQSTYLDSQAIGPGSAYTYDITYNGSGNRPKTPGDAIFHCHFYPHFAQGMWGLWRNHDTFEPGTELDQDGIPVPGARALPDGEIAAGTPIPALVPLPGLPMPPMPTASLPGFPFYIPAVAGHRAPQPPLDFAKSAGQAIDGGLPRHVVTGGNAAFPPVNRLDFGKENTKIYAQELPEPGTLLEKNAMAWHQVRKHDTYVQPTDGSAAAPGEFVANGLPAVAGAPYADPCVDDDGNAAGTIKRYKAAAFQIDAVYNKAAWHFPQHRMLALWKDVSDIRAGTKAPEPLFFRANTDHCIEYWLTNLLPNVYELDDFQVRTPTDVVGQHIHLVKFDVTSSDGAANGFNYEDGSLSPDEVRERIAAINAAGGIRTVGGSKKTLTADAHPFFGGGDFALGAQTTIQRWFADDVKDEAGNDRTLRTVFTHDHFSPSTHQQAGYYAGLLVEPKGSVWRDSETGTTFGNRNDGGPTSWRADIITSPSDKSYREFSFEFQDMALQYYAGSDNSLKWFDAGNGHSVQGIADPANAVNPPAREEVGLPLILARPEECPGGVTPPCPEAVSADDPGGMTVNYRSEPIALRVRDPASNIQAAGLAGDLAHAFRSNLTRADPLFNVQPTFYPALTADVRPGDPFTPLLRAYETDRIQIRILVGAHEEGHNFSVNGAKWLFEPNWQNSGHRSSQMMGISEHFEFELGPTLPVKGSTPTEDYLYKPGSSVDDLWTGMWGLMRIYSGKRADLKVLPNNSDGKAPKNANPKDFAGVCPKKTTGLAPERKYTVVAALAKDILPGGTLVFNKREPLHDPTAIMYVRKSDLNSSGKLKTGVPIEPLVLRAAAGECVFVTLENRLPATLPDLPGFSTMPMIVDAFNTNQLAPSSHVGLHPQLVTYDMYDSDGQNAGFNQVQTAPPGGTVAYKWYAGDTFLTEDGFRRATPIEFGAINLLPADPIKHTQKGAIGALIIEPRGATWSEDGSSRASATVTYYNVQEQRTKTFRDFVFLFQDDLNLRRGSGTGTPVPNLADSEDPEDSGQKGVNYRTEPMWQRLGFEPDMPLTGGHGGSGATKDFDFSHVLANGTVGGDPVTPIFKAKVGQEVRFRVLHPGGHQRNHSFVVHGHVWQQLPYTQNSEVIGLNQDPQGRWMSEFYGAQAGIGPTSHFNMLLQNGAGGQFKQTGDYLVRDFQSFQFDGGIWALLRVY